MKKKIAVYCGSSMGNSERYQTATKHLASVLVNHQLDLVYGGGNVGLMGVLADEMLRLGAHVTGVIPQRLLDAEVAHHGIQQLEVVTTMHERKARMFELADYCLALPGGIGTMEELFEAFTWTQLGFHNKPCGVLDMYGYYQPFQQLLNKMVQEGFLKVTHKDMLLFDDDAGRLIPALMQR